MCYPPQQTNKATDISANAEYDRGPQSKKERLYYIDNLRVLACFLVLLTHSTMHTTQPDKDGFWMFGISFIGSPSSELFLALSGTVLLPVKTGFRQFYKRRFIKLLPPLFIWSILGVLLYTQTRGWSWSTAWNTIIRIPLQPSIGVYWFVYAMAGLYLLAPFISPWLHKATKSQVEFFLSLWLINLIFPWILYFFPDVTNLFLVTGNYYWTLCYFGGFLGYWILGYYLRKYPIIIGPNYKWGLLITGVILYPLSIFAIKIHGGDTAGLTDNLQLGSALFVTFLYTLFMRLKFRANIQKWLSRIAKYSFGIYLTHIYVRNMFWNMFEGSKLHIFPRTFLIAILVMITGYLITYLLSKIPKGKYITGT